METDEKGIKRNERGQLVVGTSGGPGRPPSYVRPPREIERAYVEASKAAVPPERWQAIVAHLADLAMGVSADGPVTVGDRIRATSVLAKIFMPTLIAIGAVEAGKRNTFDPKLLSKSELDILKSIYAKARVVSPSDAEKREG